MDKPPSPSRPFSVLAFFHEGEDFRVLQDLLEKSHPGDYIAIWEADTPHVLEAAHFEGRDILLVDDRNGPKMTISFLRELRRKGILLPIVVLTQFADIQPSRDYVEAGADDLIPRDRLNAFVLDRVLRHAITHRRTLTFAYETEERFHKLLAQLSEPVAIHHKGTLLEFNDAAARLFGYARKDLPDLTLSALFPVDARDKVMGHEEAGSSEKLMTLGLKKDGHTFHLAFQGQSFRYHNTDARLVTFVDLTPLKDRDKEIEYLLQRLRQDNDRLVQSERLKDTFLSSISGELRSPLTAIMGYLRLLKMEGLGSLNPGQAEAVESAHKNAKRLATLVDDVLDMSRLDPGSTPLDLQETSSEKLLNGFLAAFRPLAEKKGLRLATEIVPGDLLVDIAKIERVVSHLLRNALRYTQAGGTVTLGAHPHKDRQQAGWLIFVKDTGAGVPEAELESVFERFYRMDSHPHDSMAGLGVGLAVSRRIMEAHGGRIWAENVPGSPGVVFKVFLPQASLA